MAVTAYPIGITKSLQNWDFNHSHVERPLDNSMYEAAHPDDTLILAGPARRNVAQSDPGSAFGLLALGMLQALSFNSQAPIQPMMAIGSARSFFLRGKSQTTWNMSRVMINGRNLLRALYHNAVMAGIPVDQFDDPAAMDNAPTSQFFINLDSELYYIPFGIGAVIRSKDHSYIAAVYLEVCVINSYGFAVAAGQSMMAENITGLCDRVLPWSTSDAMQNTEIDKNTRDAILGMANNSFPKQDLASVATFDDSGLSNGTVQLDQ